MGLCKRILTIPCFMVFNISLFSVELHAEDTTRYTFDNAVLMGNASLNDLRSFNAAGLLPGTYIVDIYINDSWRGRRELLFKKNKRGDLVSCYSGQFLKGLGVNPDKMNAALAAQPSHCGTIAEWDNSGKASEQLNAAQLELRIAIPQAYVDNIESNYVQPELWQPGIPAINFGYNADYYSSQQRGNERSSTDSAWLGMDIRTSAGGWLLEHFGSQSWDSKAGSHYANNRTTLKRPIVGWKSMFSAGKFYTDSQMFDSIAILGVGLESEDLMRPDSTLNWAPVIRGVAETNARVTITQTARPFIKPPFRPVRSRLSPCCPPIRAASCWSPFRSLMDASAVLPCLIPPYRSCLNPAYHAMASPWGPWMKTIMMKIRLPLRPFGSTA